MSKVNGLLIDAIAKSLEKSIRFTLEYVVGEPAGLNPPPNQPKFPPFCRRTLEDLACPDVADKLLLAKLNGPLGDADTESFEKSIRSTIAVNDGIKPPPNQP